MTHSVITFSFSALIIVIAGFYLTKSADAIAEKTKLGKALVGGIFLAAATSLPELFVDLNSIRNNSFDLAVGDLFGSSLFNLLILAIADLMHRNHKSMFSPSAQTHAISALMSINVTAIAGLAVFSSTMMNFYSIIGVSLPIWAILLSYILSLRLIYSNQRLNIPHVETSSLKMTLPRAIVSYLVCSSILFVVAPHLSDAAAEIAEQSGLGKTFVGTTLLAMCTSLPELVSTITAVRMGAFDLAIGNIFGSNAFNMILLVPLDMYYTGSLLSKVSQTHAFTALATITTTSIAAMGQLYQVEKRLKIIEPDALAIIVITIVFLFLLFWFQN